jgi:thiamine pyrophosphate-dependent acetolactate synthase large subunit-like protein
VVNPDFALLATAYGARGVVARTPDELRTELGVAWGETTPTVIEVPLP